MMAIITNEFEQFVGRFIRRRFPVGHIPQWVRDALFNGRHQSLNNHFELQMS